MHKELLREAARYYDAENRQLADSARRAGIGGFRSAGEWMRIALASIRNQPVQSHATSFQFLGVAKYTAAISVALVVVGVSVAAHCYWAIPLALLVFYAVEAQLVFLFPLAVDGKSYGWAANRKWVTRAGGTIAVMSVVMPVAVTMLFNGFRGKGFVRSWCLGCLAILIWYEKLRCGEVSATPRLTVGTNQPLHIRLEQFPVCSSERPLKLMYASDLHLAGKTSIQTVIQLIRAARKCQPDHILLGGDLVDVRQGLKWLTRTIRGLVRIAPVHAIAGNHDQFVGLSKVQRAVEAGGGQWLEQRAVTISRPEHAPLVIHGHYVGAIDDGAIHILCAHNPDIFPQAARHGFDLVLAGHLHGGQIVLAEHAGRMFPAGWFYRWNGLKFRHAQTTMLVSRGVSDTIPIRWNCPREVLLCEIY